MIFRGEVLPTKLNLVLAPPPPPFFFSKNERRNFDKVEVRAEGSSSSDDLTESPV